MNPNIPDTSIAQALYLMRAVLPVTLTCIGASAVVLVVALGFGAENSTPRAVLDAVIMAVLSYAATRHYLSNGQAGIQGPLHILREPAFFIFLQIELLATVVLALFSVASQIDGFAVAWFLGYGLILFAYARYGTILPALVAGDDASVAAARARQTTRPLLMRLTAAVGLGFTMMIGLVLLPSATIQLGADTGAPTGLFVMAPATAAISAFISVLVSVVLAKAYQGRYSAR